MFEHRFSWEAPDLPLDPVALALELKGFNPSQPRGKDGRWGNAGREAPTIGEAFLSAEKVGGSHKITVHNSRVKKYAGHDSVESFVAGHKRGRAAALRELAADHKVGKISLHAPETGETPTAARPKAPLTASAHPTARYMNDTTHQDAANAAGISDAEIEARAKKDWTRGDAAWSDGAQFNRRLMAREDAAKSLLKERSAGKKAEIKPPAEKPADTADHSAAKAEAGRSLRGSFLAKPGASLKPLARDGKRSDLDTLRAAHEQVAHSGEAARLSHVRQALSNYSRPEQDRMLSAAVRAPNSAGVSLSQIDDNKAIDGVEKTAAFSPAGEPFHLLRTTHRGRKSADERDLDEIDGSDLSGVTEDDLRALFDDALLASAGYA